MSKVALLPGSMLEEPAPEKIASAMNTYAWTPSQEQLDAANVTRLARALGCADYAELHRLSIDDPARFWPAVAADLELELARPWDRVLDDSRGIEWTTWFEGARLNVATACLHVWAERTPDAPAAVFAGRTAPGANGRSPSSRARRSGSRRL